MLIKLKKKKPIFIIGGGFSAAIANLYLDKVSKIISFNNNILFNKKEFIRRKSIECNKLFVKKSYSFGTLNFSLASLSSRQFSRLQFGLQKSKSTDRYHLGFFGSSSPYCPHQASYP